MTSRTLGTLAGITTLLATLCVDASAQDCPDQTVTASDAAEGAVLGVSVALSDDAAIIGAMRHGDDDHGAAYVFRHDGADWVEEAALVASDAGPGDLFGYQVSVSGDRAIVGAPYEDGVDASQGDAGAAYVFRLDDGTWIEEAKLVAPVRQGMDRFGWSVSISGTLAVVGRISGTGFGGGASGPAAHVFRHDGSEWLEEAVLLASDWEHANFSYFAESLAIHGDCLVVGAPSGGDGGSEAAYVFRYDGVAWTEEAKLVAGDEPTQSYFGNSVSLSESGEIILVGSSRNDEGGENRGAAYVFRNDGTEWVEEAKLQPDDAAEGDFVGWSVSMHGERALVGAGWGWNEGPSNGADSAYVYRNDGTSWVEESSLAITDSTGDVWAGGAVALTDDVVLLGSYLTSEHGNASGSATFFGCPRDPDAVPEVSPPGLNPDTGAFAVQKEGSNLRLTWQDLPVEVSVLAGNLDSLRGSSGYDHQATSACRVRDAFVVLSDPMASRSYFLLVGSTVKDGGEQVQGSLGRDSRGDLRPTTEDLGLPSCR